MAMSSDEIIKREIIDIIGYNIEDIKLRVFPDSSNEDQILFSEGGLTFGYNNTKYGSCDAAWYIENKEYVFPYDNTTINTFPVVALEGTDCLQRGSSGNAQYQRFHHALGAVRGGSIGVYYLRRGEDTIRPELYGMAYFASQTEKGSYLVMQDLKKLKDLLTTIAAHGIDSPQVQTFLNDYIDWMLQEFNTKLFSKFNNDWHKFAKTRSTLIFDAYIVKHAGRMKRNFTDSEQRAGHIAVGEMYLSKYFFPDKKLLYLWPKMSRDEVDYLNRNKTEDKEWNLLTHEPNVTIITRDELCGLDAESKNILYKIKDEPLKGEALKTYNHVVKNIIVPGLENGTLTIDKKYL